MMICENKINQNQVTISNVNWQLSTFKWGERHAFFKSFAVPSSSGNMVEKNLTQNAGVIHQVFHNINR